MKYLTLFAILTACLVSCKQNDHQAKYTLQKPVDSTTTAYKSEKDIEEANEKNYSGEWREPADGNESVAVTELLTHTNIPCGEFLIRNKVNSPGSYFCACKPGVSEHEKWTYLEIWPSLNKWTRIRSSEIKNPAPQN